MVLHSLVVAALWPTLAPEGVELIVPNAQTADSLNTRLETIRSATTQVGLSDAVAHQCWHVVSAWHSVFEELHHAAEPIWRDRYAQLRPAASERPSPTM